VIDLALDASRFEWRPPPSVGDPVQRSDRPEARWRPEILGVNRFLQKHLPKDPRARCGTLESVALRGIECLDQQQQDFGASRLVRLRRNEQRLLLVEPVRTSWSPAGGLCNFVAQ